MHSVLKNHLLTSANKLLIDLLTSEMKRNIFVLICVFAIVAVVYAKVQSCGVPKRGTGFVLGGQTFKRGDYPWLVALMLLKNPPQFFCGGTIISSSFVLTGKLEASVVSQQVLTIPLFIV